MAKQTPEGKVKAEIKRILDEFGAYYFMPVQNGMGAPALDFHCAHRGFAFFIEAKAPGKKPTARQEMTMKRTAVAGCTNFVIDGEDGYVKLRNFLKMLGVMHEK